MSAPVFELTADGDLVFPSRLISGPSAKVQRAIVRLRTHLGEYVLDRFAGINWIALRDNKMTDAQLQLVRSTIVAELNAMDGVRVQTSGAAISGRQVSVVLEAVIEDEADADELVGLEFGLGGGLPSPLTLLRLIRGGLGAA